jgi:hypothetical protein
MLQWTTFDYPLVSPNLSITLYCLSFFNGRLLITPWYLQTFLLHCVVCPSVIKGRPLKKDRQYNEIERFGDTKG